MVDAAISMDVSLLAHVEDEDLRARVAALESENVQLRARVEELEVLLHASPSETAEQAAKRKKREQQRDRVYE